MSQSIWIPVLAGIAVLCVLAFVAVMAILHAFRDRTRTQAPEATLIQNQMESLARQTTQQGEALRQSLRESMDSLQAHVQRALSEANRNLGERLDSTGKVIGDVRQQLGQLDESSKRILDIGQDISRLEQILQPPKLRGSLGELFLGDLLAQVLPAAHYTLQHRFKGGEVVDAAIRLSQGIVAIDAKFPLENFRRIFSAANDAERTQARKAFITDVKKHIDAIALKYIRPDEQTFDFALMYIPAENVYYETIIKDDAFGGEMSLFIYSLKKRVIPVSPNSFYAYLQTIALGLRGLQVEERAREIVDSIARLKQEFAAFGDAYRLVGQHLENSRKRYDEATRRMGRVETKLDQIGSLAPKPEELDAPAGQALPPPA